MSKSAHLPCCPTQSPACRLFWPVRLYITLACMAFALLAAMPVTVQAQASHPVQWPTITLELVRDDLGFPSFAIAPPGETDQFFLVQREGRIYVRVGDAWRITPFLDIRDRVATGGECGLLSMAFPPDYGPENPVFYVYYSANQDLIGPEPDPFAPDIDEPNEGCDTVIARFRLSDNPLIADAGSEEQIWLINQPYTNHNGGQIAFGPDGMLYIGLGDGGLGGDPLRAGQRPNTLLGKMLRIQVGDSPTYTVPIDNPLTDDENARPEIWSLGLRNPYRFSFDRLTGDLYIADVGQNAWEEINFQPHNAAGGENYGWAIVEGPECYLGRTCNLENFTPPVYTYPHEGSGCSGSVTGGYMYRGESAAHLGIYIFGDYCTRKIRGLQYVNRAWSGELLLETDLRIASFGEDATGELYVMGLEGSGNDLRGVLYRLRIEVPSSPSPALFMPHTHNGASAARSGGRYR